MKKWYVASLLAVALIVTMGASSNSTSSNTSANSLYPTPPEGGFKNLKVLPQNISKDALDSIMGEFSVSLGVRCNFCHARKSDTTKKGLDFASDAKEAKNTAREMYKMTAFLNLNYFNWNHSTKPDTIHSIVCYTCHRGSNEVDADVFLKRIDSVESSFHKNHGK